MKVHWISTIFVYFFLVFLCSAKTLFNFKKFPNFYPISVDNNKLRKLIVLVECWKNILHHSWYSFNEFKNQKTENYWNLPNVSGFHAQSYRCKRNEIISIEFAECSAENEFKSYLREIWFLLVPFHGLRAVLVSQCCGYFSVHELNSIESNWLIDIKTILKWQRQRRKLCIKNYVFLA